MNEYDQIERLNRQIFWLQVTKEAAIVALIAFVSVWFIVS